MAKIVKKKAPAKAAKATKSTSKATTKKAAPVKAAKATAKKAEKTVVKKKAAAAKPVAKKAAPIKKKVEAKAPVKAKAVKPPVKEVKATKKAAAPQEEVVKKPKKVAEPQPVVEEKPKKEAKAVVAPKKGVKAKKEKEKEKDESLDEDFISEDGLGDEIGEYEEELKAVEEADEEIEVEEEWTGEEKAPEDEEIYLTDAEGRRYCRARDCDQAAVVDVYCRYHYLLYWKKIQIRKKILDDGKLERYVEELTSRYPDKFLEMIRRDLRTEKDFLAAIQELELDETAQENDYEEDSRDFIEEVRGMGENSSSVDDDDY